MEADFHNSRIVSVLGLSTFVLGISFGPMFLSPLSEFYGRRPIYLVSWTLYVIFIIPQAVAKNIAEVIVFRFIDGFTGSAFLAVSGGTVGDLFTKSELQAPMALFSVSPFIGPSLGPLLGGFINYNVDWRWTYWILLIWSGIVWTAVVLLVPETYRKLGTHHTLQSDTTHMHVSFGLSSQCIIRVPCRRCVRMRHWSATVIDSSFYRSNFAPKQGSKDAQRHWRRSVVSSN